MSKNLEIVAEIIADQTGKLEKLVSEQTQLVKDFSITIDKASTIEIQPKTERLEEIISHWNNLFTAQKDQLKELQRGQNTENKKQRLWTNGILLLVFLQLLVIIAILILKNI